jgi:hypothetical protein
MYPKVPKQLGRENTLLHKYDVSKMTVGSKQ